ncbi:v-type c subunit family protein, putative [Ichthyophthirius multifiliis]|uniref:V-type proton ATPase proteolipid subunit n=1 Tax=Ichthyophthirius multifiliis TaxID=5932 RepID=G0QJ92_ICHMU|nr:v-type c subunit family protein, putative [Ichthyophthirius multifiliis]EGR34701.1 v-type c subunit family protein, putative [Ichthyophthirius multifiliis]|eukprot:XP_004040005.1 v-type c subunit family protein, putative [Ichthyophthirius multifiliis]
MSQQAQEGMGIEYLFGYVGVASALVFANIGAAYGTAKSGVGISYMGISKPELIMKSIIPVVMAGILGIYGMIVAVILVQKINKKVYSSYECFSHLAAGLCCGISSLAAGLAIGVVGDAGVRAILDLKKLIFGKFC